MSVSVYFHFTEKLDFLSNVNAKPCQWEWDICSDITGLIGCYLQLSYSAELFKSTGAQKHDAWSMCVCVSVCVQGLAEIELLGSEGEEVKTEAVCVCMSGEQTHMITEWLPAMTLTLDVKHCLFLWH